MKKSDFVKIVALMLLLCNSAFGQCFSNNPYELYWERYLMEHDSLTIAKNNIKAINAYRVEIKKGKEKYRHFHFKAEFNRDHQPVKFVSYMWFSLKNSLVYNPIWRIMNEYPEYTIWTYNLYYTSNKKLQSVLEERSHTNREFIFYGRLSFTYDSLDRVVLQKSGKALNRKYRLTAIDSIYESHTDSFTIKYSDNNQGLLIIKKFYSLRHDTLQWVGSPCGTVRATFGNITNDRKINAPMDRNISHFSTFGKNARITEDTRGLIIMKEENLDIPENEIVFAKSCYVIKYEYEFFDP